MFINGIHSPAVHSVIKLGKMVLIACDYLHKSCTQLHSSSGCGSFNKSKLRQLKAPSFLYFTVPHRILHFTVALSHTSHTIVHMHAGRHSHHL